MNLGQMASEVGLGSILNITLLTNSNQQSLNDGLILQLLLILVLTMINAFFAASEMALVSVNQNRIERDAEDGDKKAIKILRILEDQSNFLSTIQVAITLAGLFNSAAAATGISQRLGGYLSQWNLPYSYTIATILITLILSYITIVFGELVPKRVALNKSESIAKFSAGIISFTSIVFKPFVLLLSFSTNLVLKLIGVPTEYVDGKVTLSDIKSLVQLGQTQGVIDDVESDMINSVIGFDDTYAEEIMTARPEVFMIDINEPFEKFLDEMLNLKYSRIPVYEDEVDNIIGIIYLKDYLLESYNKGFENVQIKDILKPAYFVPEKKNVNDLFSELQSNNKHMALLIDEYGGFSGIVTMEDLIEEIVGEIDDEYDHDEPEISKITEEVWIAKGSTQVKDLNYQLGIELDEDTEDYDTLGGLIIHLLGHIPEDGEQMTLSTQNVVFDVLEVKDKRINEVKITVLDQEEETQEE